ncbi:SPW repeat domain-containing protein [Actinosynnema sp. CA-248983]
MVQAVFARHRGEIAVVVSAGIGATTGLWLTVSPLVLGYSSHSTPARWNDLAAGGVTLLAAVGLVVLRRRAWATLALLGGVSAWLLLAPTLLDLRVIERVAAINDLLSGALLAIVVLLHFAAISVRDGDTTGPSA